MSKHKPVSRQRWLATQKLMLQRWKKRSLEKEQAHMERTYLPFLQRYAKALDEQATVLEIGCGPVCISSHLPQENKTYLDPLIDDYRRLFPGQLPESGEYLSSMAERILKPAASFDLIICLNMISHSLNPELIMHEVERLLKPDGMLIFSLRIHSSLEARLHYWAVRAMPVLCRKTRPYYYSLHGIRRTLERHFAIEQEHICRKPRISLPLLNRERRLFVCRKKPKEKQSSDS